MKHLPERNLEVFSEIKGSGKWLHGSLTGLGPVISVGLERRVCMELSGCSVEGPAFGPVCPASLAPK